MKCLLAVLICVIISCFISGCGKQAVDESKGVSESASIVQADEIKPWNHPEACFECHKSSYESWKDSHHANANRRIDPSKDRDVFEAGGDDLKFRFHADGDVFWIDDLSIENSEEAKWASTPIDSVIGYEPIWQYLVPQPSGGWQTHAMTWDVGRKEWFNVFGDEDRDTGDWGHWTQRGMNWNSNCAFCHMTDFKKNYDFRTNRYSSSWVIEGVSCIQCHEGMEKHVREAREGESVAPVDVNLQIAMENCASCHSRREELTLNEFRAGQRFHNHFRLTLPNEPGVYFENGLANQEDYVYTSFVLSKMGEKGVSCFDCHDPHTAKTKLPQRDNALCMQCHGTGLKDALLIDEATHSHHVVGSLGASCVDCHMPERTYMGRDARRDHGFTIPDPQSTIDREEPNACNQCHTEEPPEWALDHVLEWFGETDRSRFQQRRASALHDAHSYAPSAWRELVSLYDESSNVYWKTTYMRMMADYSAEAPVWDRALEAMGSKSPEVRDASIRVLLNRREGLEPIRAALKDPSRLVRVQAADVLSSLFDGTDMAFQEWQKYIEMNADRPAGALKRAELALLQGERTLATQLVKQAVQMDRNNPSLYYDASILLSRTGEVDEALALLDAGGELRPELPALAYAKGLLYGEKRDFKASVQAFERAVMLDPTQGRWWYNLSIASMNAGNLERASSALDRALEISPEDAAYLDWQRGLDQMMTGQ